MHAYSKIHSVIFDSLQPHAYVHAQSLSSVWLFTTPWTGILSGSSTEFSGQEHLNGLSFPFPGGLLDPEMEPVSCTSCTGRRILYHCASWEAYNDLNLYFNNIKKKEN